MIRVTIRVRIRFSVWFGTSWCTCICAPLVVIVTDPVKTEARPDDVSKPPVLTRLCSVCLSSVEWGVLPMGEFQRHVWSERGDTDHIGAVRSHARRSLRTVWLLRRMLDRCVRSPRVPLLRSSSLRRTDTGARTVQGPSVPQRPRRLHGRQFSVCRRSAQSRYDVLFKLSAHLKRNWNKTVSFEKQF